MTPREDQVRRQAARDTMLTILRDMATIGIPAALVGVVLTASGAGFATIMCASLAVVFAIFAYLIWRILA